MKTEKIKVSRTVDVPGQENTERATTVSFKYAESAAEMIEACGGDAKKAIEYFNAGRWAEFRTKVSNALAGKTPQQRAVDKMVAGMLSINPSLNEQQARQLILSMPNMQAAASVTTQKLPAEIDETYFDKNPEAAADATETSTTA